MGKSIDQTPKRNATPEELQRYDAAHEQVSSLDYEGTYQGADNPI